MQEESIFLYIFVHHVLEMMKRIYSGNMNLSLVVKQIINPSFE